MKGFERSIHWGVAIACCMFVGAIIFDRSNPSPVYLVEDAIETVKPGGSLRVKYTVDRKRVCMVDSYRTIVDSVGTRFEQHKLETASSVTGPDTYSRLFVVDERASEGNAIMRTTILYVCNPIHMLFPIVMRLPDYNFIIKK